MSAEHDMIVTPAAGAEPAPANLPAALGAIHDRLDRLERLLTRLARLEALNTLEDMAADRRRAAGGREARARELEAELGRR